MEGIVVLLLVLCLFVCYLHRVYSPGESSKLSVHFSSTFSLLLPSEIENTSLLQVADEPALSLVTLHRA